MPHAAEGHRGQHGLREALSHDIGAELTGSPAATIRREGRLATGILHPATGPLLVHDPV
jgi:hypothetical protein